MGLFLSMSATPGTELLLFEGALRNALANQGLRVDSVARPSADARLRGEYAIVVAGEASISVLYPAHLLDWDEASSFLSRELERPVFSFHIHDGDFWMYQLFNNGVSIDRFNPVPEYWGELAPEEKDSWRGDATVIAREWPGVDAGRLRKYLAFWDLDDEQYGETKAWPEDEYGRCDWQLVDFLKKLRIRYPDHEAADARFYAICPEDMVSP